MKKLVITLMVAIVALSLTACSDEHGVVSGSTSDRQATKAVANALSSAQKCTR